MLTPHHDAVTPQRLDVVSHQLSRAWSPMCSLEIRLAFVTSTLHNGNLGGLIGADTICNMRAAAAGLPGTYMAWLSTAGIDAQKRVGNGGWMRTDGRPFTHSLKNLTDPAYLTVYYPPRVDEAGNDLGNVSTLVATGGTIDGVALGDQCTGYTRTTGNLYVGDARRDPMRGAAPSSSPADVPVPSISTASAADVGGRDPKEISQKVAELKQYAKSFAKSIYIMDRRRAR